jgi:hypothetical protein
MELSLEIAASGAGLPQKQEATRLFTTNWTFFVLD